MPWRKEMRHRLRLAVHKVAPGLAKRLVLAADTQS